MRVGARYNSPTVARGLKSLLLRPGGPGLRSRVCPNSRLDSDLGQTDRRPGLGTSLFCCSGTTTTGESGEVRDP